MIGERRPGRCGCEDRIGEEEGTNEVCNSAADGSSTPAEVEVARVDMTSGTAGTKAGAAKQVPDGKCE